VIYEDETMETGEGDAAAEATTDSEAGASSDSEATEVATESSEIDVSAEETVAEEAPAEPEFRLPDFDFEAWDGEVATLPEVYHPIHGHLSGHIRKEIDGLRNSLEQDRELYQALLEGEDIGKDFREKLSKSQAELEKIQKSRETWGTEKEQYDEKIKHYESKMAEVEASEKAEADAWAHQFRQDNADIMEETEKRGQFLKFMNSGIEPEVAVEFVRSGNEHFVQSTLGYMAQGVPPQYAVRMAKTDSGLTETQSAQPRAGAEMTAGATEGANVPESTEKAVSSNTFGIEDARRLAVQRAFRKRTG